MPRGRVHFALSLALIYCGLLNSIFCKAQTTPKWDINPVLSRRMPSHLQKIEADNNTLAHKWDINPVLSRRMPPHLQKTEADNDTLAHKWDINPVLSRRMPPHLQKTEADNNTLAHKWDINPVLSRRMPPHLQKIEADNDTLAHKWDINPVLSRRMPPHLQKIEADNDTLAHKWDINPALSRRMPPHLQKIEADNDTLAHKWDINSVLSRRMPPHLQKIEADNDTLAHKLLEALLRESPRKNIIFSPMSISTSLAKLSLENKSTVFTDLLKDLGFDLKDIRKWDVHQLFQKLHQLDRNIELKHGDILFVGKNRKMDSTFLHKLKNTLGMKVHMVNFQDEEKTKKKINHHVAEKMQEKIDELATDLDPHTLLFLVNYILFKGIWEKAFQANLTQEDFFVDEKTIVPVDMMKKTELMIYKRSEELSATMVKMLCKGNVSVVLVLPDVRQSESALQEILSKRAELMKSGDTRLVHIVMPRLKISSKINLRKLLPVLGIENLFTPKADLLGITKDHLPAILEAVHEARVEVSEEGVAVDAAKHVDEKAALPKAWTASPIVVKFNRPFFLFVQNEKTQKELFVGKVFNPK